MCIYCFKISAILEKKQISRVLHFLGSPFFMTLLSGMFFFWMNKYILRKQEYIWMAFKNEPRRTEEEEEKTCLKITVKKNKGLLPSKISFSWAHHDPDYVTTTLKASIWTKVYKKNTTTNREKTSPWITTKEEPDLFMFLQKFKYFPCFFFC